ncbi:RNA-directed DNA polymerase [Clostridium botulinum]|uniref:RNA-directed DNA polymerase n=1 Tax=Clostridium botulinum TaxID=1491 RepID=UPI003DA1C94F
MVKLQREYDFVNTHTKYTYEYIIKEILDKDEDIKGYKNIKPNPSINNNVHIANEIYAFFLAHYFKAKDVYYQNKKLTNININNKEINIIDIGSNIGTVTFAYIDFIIENNENINCVINIIFIEADSYRVRLLKKAIDKYTELSALKINYCIINKYYEDSVENICKKNFEGDTIILISNLLRWIKDLDKFKQELINNINKINNEVKCNVVNIETTSYDANKKLIRLYEEIDNFSNKDNDIVRAIYWNKKMPRFKNICGCYYWDQKGVKKYKSDKSYYYGYIIKDNDLCMTGSIEYISKAYYKALYTVRNYYLYDNLEIKYINSNLGIVIKYISELIKQGKFIEDYEYQYRIKKNKNEYRALYIDDFINDIINTSILITKGLKFDDLQNDKISFGNRLNHDLESPFTFNIYYEQYFAKYKKQEEVYMKKYKYYYKIDLKQYYNNIYIEKLLDKHKLKNGFGSKWYDKMIKCFTNKELYDCQHGYGLAQGPDISHLLANMYLQDFDEWYLDKYKNDSMIRYVDDIIIFANSKEECESIYNESKIYLEKELNLKIGEKKTEHGYTNLNIDKKDDIYFQEVIEESNLILRSIYKLDKNNFNKYKNNPEQFISIYQKCLNKMGIHLSKEWLNIKIDKELSFLQRLKNKIQKDRKLLSWLKSKYIYDISVRLGDIPENFSEDEIDNWYYKFSKNNKKYVNRISKLAQVLDNKLEDILKETKYGKITSKDAKSIFKFTMNKLQVFKSPNIMKYIDDIYEYYPYCNKKILSSYTELGTYIRKCLEDSKLKTDLYDYAIYIWLLGEYKNEENLDKIEEIFRKSYNNESFINTLATESLLKIGKVTEAFKEELLNGILNSNNYYFSRNKLLLISAYCTNQQLNDVINSINNVNDERINIFISWLVNNNGTNIINKIEEIPKNIKQKYPDYPISNEYLSL